MSTDTKAGRWCLLYADLGSTLLAQYLSEGWEPFGCWVTNPNNGDYVQVALRKWKPLAARSKEEGGDK